MNNNKFISTLKAINAAKAVDGLAELITFAAEKWCDGTNDAMDALMSTVIKAGWRGEFGAVLRQLKITDYARLTTLSEPVEYKGLKITHRLKPKGKAKDHENGAELTGDKVKDALRFQMQLASDIETVADAIEITRLEKEVEKAKKKEEAKAKKETSEYWQDRIAKLVAEAGKHGFQIDAKLLGKLVEQAA